MTGEERGIETLSDLSTLLKDISKEVIQSIYEGEITDHLGYPPHMPHAAQITGNSRDGYVAKTVRTITDSVMDSAEEWQTRSLELLYRRGRPRRSLS